MHPLNPHLIRELAKTPGVLSLWVDVGPVPPQGGVNLFIAAEEAQLASLYARRQALAHVLLPNARVEDVERTPPALWAITPSGEGMYLVLEAWGQVPQRLRYAPRLLFDRTGRIRQRWRFYERPERRPFAEMDAAAAQTWFALWAMALVTDPVAQGWYCAEATQALLRFLAAAEGMPLPVMLHTGALRHVPDLAHTLAAPLPLRERGRRLVDVLSRESQRVALQHGWKPPDTLEAAARRVWRQHPM